MASTRGYRAKGEPVSPTNTYLQYTFVAAGVSNRTWDVIMPTAPGSYEFRLLCINTYTVAARSPAVTVGN
jgi:hypothetical protein